MTDKKPGPFDAAAKVDKMLELCGRAMHRVFDNKTYDILDDPYDLLAALAEPKGEKP